MTRIPSPGDWPAVLSIPQIALAWKAAGGRALALVVSCSVCLAESSGNRYAISPAGARGLYQIMPFNFGATGLTESTWQNPVSNSSAAVQLSSNGYNWAAWDSCYTDIYVTGRLSFLAWPQPLSPADKYISQVERTLGITGQPGSVEVTPMPNSSHDQNAANRVMGHVHVWQRNVLPTLHGHAAIFNRMFR